MSLSVSPVQSAKGRKARATALHGIGSPQVLEASRDLAAAKLEQYIAQVVSEAPPLTQAQRSKLSALIGGGA